MLCFLYLSQCFISAAFAIFCLIHFMSAHGSNTVREFILTNAEPPNDQFTETIKCMLQNDAASHGFVVIAAVFHLHSEFHSCALYCLQQNASHFEFSQLNTQLIDEFHRIFHKIGFVASASCGLMNACSNKNGDDDNKKW